MVKIRGCKLRITPHLNGIKLSNSSLCDFESIFDIGNPNGLCPGQNFVCSSLVFFENQDEVKWRPLKQTISKNKHHFSIAVFHNQKLCCLAEKDSLTLNVLKLDSVFFKFNKKHNTKHCKRHLQCFVLKLKKDKVQFKPL